MTKAQQTTAANRIEYGPITRTEFNDRIRAIQDYDDAQQSERMAIYDQIKAV